MVWITGYRGMLGSEVARQLSIAGIAFVASDLELDICDAAAVDRFFTQHQIDWVVNCAAYTAVDKAEDEEEKALRINALGPENLARSCAKHGTRLIHLSTDYVFPGTEPGARKEDDVTAPAGAYGRTKLAGEKAVIDNTGSYFIIRTAWLYGQFGANFVYTMLRLMASKDRIKVVNDQHGSPTFADDLASLIRTIILAKSDNYGIYHYSNEGEITWFDFSKAIFEQAFAFGILNKECLVEPCSSAEYPSKVLRPMYSLLDKSKTKAAFAVSVPQWQSSLEQFLRNVSYPLKLTRS